MNAISNPKNTIKHKLLRWLLKVVISFALEIFIFSIIYRNGGMFYFEIHIFSVVFVFWGEIPNVKLCLVLLNFSCVRIFEYFFYIKCNFSSISYTVQSLVLRTCLASFYLSGCCIELFAHLLHVQDRSKYKKYIIKNQIFFIQSPVYLFKKHVFTV